MTRAPVVWFRYRWKFHGEKIIPHAPSEGVEEITQPMSRLQFQQKLDHWNEIGKGLWSYTEEK